MTDNDSWHLSKSVPITLIIGLITQGAAIVWVVSMMYGDIERNTNRLSDLDNRLDKLEDMVFAQAIAMARIDENIKAIRDDVHKMATREIDQSNVSGTRRLQRRLYHRQKFPPKRKIFSRLRLADRDHCCKQIGARGKGTQEEIWVYGSVEANSGARS